MRRLVPIALCLSMLGAVACGGGATSGAPATELATVQGKIVTRDGSTSGLEGVGVSCPESGLGDVTDAAGTFRVDVPVGLPFHVDFHDPAWPDGVAPHDGMHDPHDPQDDDAEADGDGIAVRPVARDEPCVIEVHLQDGEVVECRVSWGDGDGEEQGERRLDHDPLCDEQDAHAEVEITIENGCLAVEVEVQGFSGAANLDVHLVNAEGEEAYLATLVIDTDGVGHLEWSWCEGDALPFDAATPTDLAGSGVRVYDEEGTVVFDGHLPYHHGVGDGGPTPGDDHPMDGHHGGDMGPHHG